MARKRKSSPGPYLIQMELLRERIDDEKRFPYTLPAVRGLSVLPFHPKVTFLVGENGSGKSTLLEAIAVRCRMNPEGGGRNFHFSTRASHSSLADAVELAMTAARPGDTYFLRAESYFNLATNIEELDRDVVLGDPIIRSYGGVSLHEQSHGESFFALFRNRFRKHGLYLLDEPEAALSPKRQLEFLALLHGHVQNGCQFVIATHSPIIMAYPEATIYVLDADRIRAVPYCETEHFTVTRSFLGSPQQSLSVLLADPAAGGDDESD